MNIGAPAFGGAWIAVRDGLPSLGGGAAHLLLANVEFRRRPDRRSVACSPPATAEQPHPRPVDFVEKLGRCAERRSPLHSSNGGWNEVDDGRRQVEVPYSGSSRSRPTCRAIICSGPSIGSSLSNSDDEPVAVERALRRSSTEAMGGRPPSPVLPRHHTDSDASDLLGQARPPFLLTARVISPARVVTSR